MARPTLFFKPASRKLARDISITSPNAFNDSIKRIKLGGVTVQEKRGLILAQNRARAQLGRKNLSLKEKIQFTVIATTKLPKITK